MAVLIFLSLVGMGGAVALRLMIKRPTAERVPVRIHSRRRR